MTLAGEPRGIHAQGDRARYIAFEVDGLPAVIIVEGLSGDLQHAVDVTQPTLDSMNWDVAAVSVGASPEASAPGG